MGAPTLWTLPAETVSRILSLLDDPVDLASFSKTCFRSSRHVYGPAQASLWRSLFLQVFDDPAIAKRHAASFDRPVRKPPSNDWKREVQRRIQVRTLLSTPDKHVFDQMKERQEKHFADGAFAQVFEVLLEMLATAHPIAELSKNLCFLRVGLSQPHIQRRLLQYDGLNQMRQSCFNLRTTLCDPVAMLSARLHALYGRCSLDGTSVRRRAVVREVTYDTRNYTPETFWGPFLADGTGHVNWAAVEALMLSIRLRLDALVSPRDLADKATETAALLADCPALLDPLANARPYTQVESAGWTVPGWDWAGVTGTWTRVVNYLDWRDIASFNFGPHRQGPHGGWPPEQVPKDPFESLFKVGGPWKRKKLDGYPESVRFLRLELRAVAVGRPVRGSYVPPKVRFEDGKYPPIFWRGVTYLPGAKKEAWPVRGCTSMTPDGHVRWSLFSRLENDERWCSEGIQLGGIRSQLGVIGVWSDDDRAHDAPAGPMYFYKTV